MNGVTRVNSGTSTALTMVTEQRKFVWKGVTWANSDTCTLLTMKTEHRTFVMKGLTWAYSTYYEDKAEDNCHKGCNMG